ncbi:uncharacterized protein LOC121319953 [Polyodon spathula]|uniref:uncharacterized protein LOC121319953 n=1 Tax=Polyodon spathula TaxID=7913 RepID=UPI001B7EC176|nr:uncharacterized protein LOC121319953 [Polyodon spathula]
MASIQQRRKYIQPFNNKEISEAPKPIASYLVGKLLQKELKIHHGHFAAESMKQSYADILNKDRKTESSSPKQRLIDDILARRSIQQFDKEIQDSNNERILKEEEDRIKRELWALNLQKNHHEFIVPPHPGNDHDLQTRIQQRMESLPAMEARVKKIREELEREKLAETTVPTQTSHIKTVHRLFNEVVDEIMDDNFSLSQRADHFTEQHSWKQKQQVDRVMEEVLTDRVISLIMEQIVLESTLQFSKEIAHALYNVNKMCQALSFDVILNSAQEAGKAKKDPGKDQSGKPAEDLVHILLQQQRDRQRHRKETWSHTQKEKFTKEAKL